MKRALTRSLASLSLFAALALGCGSDDNKSSGQQGQVNQQQAKNSSTTMTKGIATAVDKNDGPGAINQLMQGAQQAQSIVTPAAGATKPQAAIVTGLRTTGTCDCVGTKCTYTDCTQGGATGVVVNGTLSWDGGNLKCVNLKYQITQSTNETTITLDCDVKVASSSITGYVKSTGSTSLGGLLADAGVNVDLGNVSWSSNTEFRNVTYANGAPTGGSVHVDATTTAAGQTYSGSADISFP
jgi:hypothetical protein